MSSMRKKHPAAYHHGDLRQALVAAALRALTHQGAADLSLRAMVASWASAHARRTGTSRARRRPRSLAIEVFATFAAVVARHFGMRGPRPAPRASVLSRSSMSFSRSQPAAFSRHATSLRDGE